MKIEEIESERFTIGRSRQADIVCQITGASRIHIEIFVENGKIFLMDKSSNGTLLNDVPLKGSGPFEYLPDMKIFLGNSHDYIVLESDLFVKKSDLFVKSDNEKQREEVSLEEEIRGGNSTELEGFSVAAFSSQEEENNDILPTSVISVAHNEIRENIPLNPPTPLHNDDSLIKKMKEMSQQNAIETEVKAQQQAREIKTIAQKEAEEIIAKAKAQADLIINSANQKNNSLLLDLDKLTQTHKELVETISLHTQSSQNQKQEEQELTTAIENKKQTIQKMEKEIQEALEQQQSLKTKNEEVVAIVLHEKKRLEAIAQEIDGQMAIRKTQAEGEFKKNLANKEALSAEIKSLEDRKNIFIKDLESIKAMIKHEQAGLNKLLTDISNKAMEGHKLKEEVAGTKGERKNLIDEKEKLILQIKKIVDQTKNEETLFLAAKSDHEKKLSEIKSSIEKSKKDFDLLQKNYVDRKEQIQSEIQEHELRLRLIAEDRMHIDVIDVTEALESSPISESDERISAELEILREKKNKAA